MGNLDKLKQLSPVVFLPLCIRRSSISQKLCARPGPQPKRKRCFSQMLKPSGRPRLGPGLRSAILEEKMIRCIGRQPDMHIHSGREIQRRAPVSGMITAMEPILKACGGLWIASGMGDADRQLWTNTTRCRCLRKLRIYATSALAY